MRRKNTKVKFLQKQKFETAKRHYQIYLYACQKIRVNIISIIGVLLAEVVSGMLQIIVKCYFKRTKRLFLDWRPRQIDFFCSNLNRSQDLRKSLELFSRYITIFRAEFVLISQNELFQIQNLARRILRAQISVENVFDVNHVKKIFINSKQTVPRKVQFTL